MAKRARPRATRPCLPAASRRSMACWCRRFGALYVARHAAVSVRGHPRARPREGIGRAASAGATALSRADADRRQADGRCSRPGCSPVIPALSALVIWAHARRASLMLRKRSTCCCGHLLYGLLVGAIALFAAAISDSAATAAIVTLAFTIGSWVLDFALAGPAGRARDGLRGCR